MHAAEAERSPGAYFQGRRAAQTFSLEESGLESISFGGKKNIQTLHAQLVQTLAYPVAGPSQLVLHSVPHENAILLFVLPVCVLLIGGAMWSVGYANKAAGGDEEGETLVDARDDPEAGFSPVVGVAPKGERAGADSGAAGA